jgi:hypothetical protein
MLGDQVVDSRDAGMAESRGDGRLAVEPARAVAAGLGGVHELHRHRAVQAVVTGFPDLAHAAAAQRGEQHVAASQHLALKHDLALARLSRIG